jgi:hypothetical protein
MRARALLAGTVGVLLLAVATPAAAKAMIAKAHISGPRLGEGACASLLRQRHRPQGHGQPAQPRHRIQHAHGDRNIAAALRRNAHDATRVLPLLGITSP